MTTDAGAGARPEAATALFDLSEKVAALRTLEHTATEEDIFFCFRLLLGRNPEPSDWVGHAMQAGHDLGRVVESYLGSLEFSRARRRPAAPGRLDWVRSGAFSILVDRDDPFVGAAIAGAGYEPEIATVFRNTLRAGMGVLDIGANLGYFTMLAASLVGPDGSVLAVEPNAANVRLLEASRRENGFSWVSVLQAAAGSALGLLGLNVTHSTGVTSALREDGDHLPDAATVPCLRLDAIVPPGQRIDLIKIDVDGSEYPALLGCQAIIRRDRPVIVTEYYPGGLASLSGIDGYAYLDWLAGLGYSLAVVEPDGTLSAASGPQEVTEMLADRGSDHLDLVCHPRGGAETATAGAAGNHADAGTDAERGDVATSFSAPPASGLRQQLEILQERLDQARLHVERANAHALDAERRARSAKHEADAAFRQAMTRQAELVSGLSATFTQATQTMRLMVGLAEARAASAEDEAGGARALIAALHASSSWRASAPLRAAGTVLRRASQARQGRAAAAEAPVAAPPPGAEPAVSLCEIMNPARYDDREWLGIHYDLERYATDKHCFQHVTGHVYRKGWEWTHCLYGLRKLGMLGAGSRALGVGVGREPVIFYLADHIAHVTATDLYDAEAWKAGGGREADLAMLEAARLACPATVDFSKITFSNQDGTKLDYDEASFDFCWSLSSIEHFGGHDAALRALREMARVVRPGGVVVLVTELLLSEEYRHPEYFTKAELLDELVGGCPELTLTGPVDFSALPEAYLVDSIVVPAGVDRRRRHVVLNDGHVQWTSVALFFRR